MFSKFSNIFQLFSKSIQQFCCFKSHRHPYLCHVPFYLSCLLFCVLLFQILSVIYLPSLPYIFLLCVVLSAIPFSSLCYPFCHISLFSAWTFLPYLFTFCVILSAISLLHTFFSFCQIPFSYPFCPLISTIFYASFTFFLPDPFFLHCFLFFPQYLLFLFRRAIRFVLSSNVCLFSCRSLCSSLNSFLSVFNEEENNGYFVFKWNSHGSPGKWSGGGGGRRYSACPSPF